MTDYKQIPFLTFVDDLEKEYPVFSCSGLRDKDGNSIDGYYAAVLLDKEKDAEPGNIGAFIRIDGWSANQLKFDEKKYHKHIKSFGPHYASLSQDFYDQEDLEEIAKEFNGRTAEAFKYGNGFLIKGSGFFEETRLLFNNHGKTGILIYKNEELKEYLLPLNEKGDKADCLIMSSEEFDKIKKNIKKMRNGTVLL